MKIQCFRQTCPGQTDWQTLWHSGLLTEPKRWSVYKCLKSKFLNYFLTFLSLCFSSLLTKMTISIRFSSWGCHPCFEHHWGWQSACSQLRISLTSLSQSILGCAGPDIVAPWCWSSQSGEVLTPRPRNSWTWTAGFWYLTASCFRSFTSVWTNCQPPVDLERLYLSWVCHCHCLRHSSAPTRPWTLQSPPLSCPS